MKFRLILLAFSICLYTAKLKSQSDPPNVIIVLANNQEYSDISYNGNKWLETKNLDEFFSKSIVFSNYHSSINGAQTKAGLLTGKLCNELGSKKSGNRFLLDKKVLSIADYFHNSKYVTAIFGKWQLGDNYPNRPMDRGFDFSLIHGGGGIGQITDYWNNKYIDDTYFKNGIPVKNEGYCNDIWFKESLQFIEKQVGERKNFFCFISLNSFHRNMNVPENFTEKFKNNEDIDSPGYYGMIQNIDHNFGLMVEKLTELQIEKNTIVIYISDNCTEENFSEGIDINGFPISMYDSNMSRVSGDIREEDHRSNFAVSWECKFNNTGSIRSQLVSYLDITPTLVDICNLETKGKYIEDFDGQSLLPIINGDSDKAFEKRIIILEDLEHKNSSNHKNYCVLRGNWRLKNGELYNIKSDSLQEINKLREFPEISSELKIFYDDWTKRKNVNSITEGRIIIGSPHCEDVFITCQDWHYLDIASLPWHQVHVRRGLFTNGYWLLNIERSGTYEVSIYRWPPESGLRLNEGAPAVKNDGKVYFPSGKKINIQNARIRIGNVIMEKDVNDADTFSRFEIQLDQGASTLNTWFNYGEDNSLGAYYVNIKKIN